MFFCVREHGVEGQLRRFGPSGVQPSALPGR